MAIFYFTDLSHAYNGINYTLKKGKERKTDEEGNNFRDMPANLSNLSELNRWVVKTYPIM